MADNWAKAREAFKAKCAAMTHCKHGHSLADCYVYDGKRHCRRCHQIRNKGDYRGSIEEWESRHPEG